MDFRRRFLFAIPLLATLLLLPLQARAQVTLTLNAGLAIASLEGDDVDAEFGSTTGLLLGAHLGFPLGGVISFAPGAYYVQKGAEAEVGNESLGLGLDYIEIPLLLAFRVTGADRPVGLSVFLGPSVAFEISCNLDLDVGDSELSSECDAAEGFNVRRNNELEDG